MEDYSLQFCHTHFLLNFPSGIVLFQISDISSFSIQQKYPNSDNSSYTVAIEFERTRRKIERWNLGFDNEKDMNLIFNKFSKTLQNFILTSLNLKDEGTKLVV